MIDHFVFKDKSFADLQAFERRARLELKPVGIVEDVLVNEIAGHAFYVATNGINSSIFFSADWELSKLKAAEERQFEDIRRFDEMSLEDLRKHGVNPVGLDRIKRSEPTYAFYKGVSGIPFYAQYEERYETCRNVWLALEGSDHDHDHDHEVLQGSVHAIVHELVGECGVGFVPASILDCEQVNEFALAQSSALPALFVEDPDDHDFEIANYEGVVTWTVGNVKKLFDYINKESGFDALDKLDELEGKYSKYWRRYRLMMEQVDTATNKASLGKGAHEALGRMIKLKKELSALQAERKANAAKAEAAEAVTVSVRRPIKFLSTWGQENGARNKGQQEVLLQEAPRR